MTEKSTEELARQAEEYNKKVREMARKIEEEVFGDVGGVKEENKEKPQVISGMQARIEKAQREREEKERAEAEAARLKAVIDTEVALEKKATGKDVIPPAK
jgi:hypothetical protein